MDGQPRRMQGNLTFTITSNNSSSSVNPTSSNITVNGTSQPITVYTTMASAKQQMIRQHQMSYGGTATVGFCDRGCRNLEVFLVLMLALLLIVFTSATPNKMIVLRVVPANQRAYALGFQFVFLRGLSFIPGPIISGTIIDNACKLWGETSCGKRTNCYDYKVDQLSSSIALFGAITAFIATILYFLGWYFCKPEEILNNEKGIDLIANDDYKKVVSDDNDNTAL